MATDAHISEKLSAWLDGDLPAGQASDVERHLSACAPCADEREMLRAGRTVLGGSVRAEPRPGFAARVGLAAAEQVRDTSSALRRWAFGGLATAAVAAGVLIAALPRPNAEGQRSDELILAQRLDLYEDLSVMQNREALENLDVVEQLDQLEAGRP
jgi:anti-sigma factor RsiW